MLGWLGLLGAAVLVHLVTLDISPSIWQDEVQQVDFGRLHLEAEREWSVKWIPETGEPLLVWSYLGPVLHELSFRLAGSARGPRGAALLGSVLAAAAMLFWLLARAVPPWAAVWLSLAFYLDPLFVKSYKGARVDAWAIALALAACLVLRRAMKPGRRPGRLRKTLGYALFAGSLAAAAAVTWQSAVILYPLIAAELYALAVERRTKRRGDGRRGGSSRETVLVVAAFGLGGLAGAVVLCTPLIGHLEQVVRDAGLFLQGSAGASHALADRAWKVIDVGAAARVLWMSGIVILAAGLGAFCRRTPALILATVLAYLMVGGTVMYAGRAVYLLPYFVVLASGLYAAGVPACETRRLPRLRAYVLAALVAWSVGMSLGVRTAVAWGSRAERHPGPLFEMAEAGLGRGEHEVFLGQTFEFYYVGRTLGWKMYTPNGPGSSARVVELLARVDAAVLRREAVTQEVAAVLRDAGLTQQSYWDVVREERGKALKGPAGVLRRDSASRPYGSYLVFRRY